MEGPERHNWQVTHMAWVADPLTPTRPLWKSFMNMFLTADDNDNFKLYASWRVSFVGVLALLVPIEAGEGDDAHCKKAKESPPW